MDETTRRRFLQISGLTGVTAGAGCLRLTTDQSESGSETRTSTINSDTGGGGTSTGQNSDDELPSVDTLYETQWERERSLDHLSLSNGYLYADDLEKVKKIDTSNGDIIWEGESAKMDSNVIVDLVAMDEYVSVLGGGIPDEDIPTRLFTLDSQSGTEQWFFEGESVEWQGGGQLAASEDYVAFVERSQNDVHTMRVFRSETASPIWEKEYNENNTYINEIDIRGNTIFALGDSVRVLDINSGEVLQTDESTATAGVITESNVYTGGNELRKLSRPELEVEWTFSPTSSLTANPEPVTSGQNSIIVPSAYGLECVDTRNGELQWEYRTASEVLDIRGGIEVSSGLAWVWDNSGFLYVIDVETGEALFDQQQKDVAAQTSDLKADGSTLYLSFTSEIETVLPSGTSKLSITDIDGS
jgi:outer membrane protein assembly factor BamB